MAAFKTIMTTLLAPVLAGSVTVAAAKSAEPVPLSPASACRLIVSETTKKLYPEGLLELAASECWAGPNSDIMVIGKHDVIPGSRHNVMMSPRLLKSATEQITALMPPDIQENFASIRPDHHKSIFTDMILAAASSTNSGAIKYQFQNSAGNITRNLFITVVDDVYNINDHLAAVAGIYLGSFINDRIAFSEMADRTNVRALNLAHETGHGANNDSLNIIRDGKVIPPNLILARQPVDNLKSETRADRHAHKKYAHAVEKGIPLAENYGLIDRGLRALSVYFSYGINGGDTLDDYHKGYARNYLGNPNPVPHHATSAALYEDHPITTREQAVGAMVFRADMNRAFGHLFYSAEDDQTYALDPELEKNFRGDIDNCEGLADITSEEGKKARPAQKIDKTTFIGNCLTHQTFTRQFAINALIRLEGEGYHPISKAAQIYKSDFSSVIEAGFLSEQFMMAPALYYTSYQRESLPAEVRTKWDKVFKDHGLMP